MSRLPAFIALDISLVCTGWAHYARGKYTYGTIETDVKDWRNKDRFARYDVIVRTVSRLMYMYKCTTLLIEGYAYSANGNATMTLAELGGYLRGKLAGHLGWAYEIPVMTYRMIATGCGTILPKSERGDRKTKDLVREAVRRLVGMDIEDDNAADAVLLAYAYNKDYEAFVKAARLHTASVL